MFQPQTADWHGIVITTSITTLIGAVVGFVVAMFSDVIKTGISDRRKLKRLRHALYNEMIWLYVNFHILIYTSNKAHKPTTMKAVFDLFDRRVFDHANAQPEEFAQLNEAFKIKRLYSFLRVPGEISEVQDVVITQCAYFVHAFEDLVQSHDLDVRLLAKIHPEVMRVIHERLNSKTQAATR